MTREKARQRQVKAGELFGKGKDSISSNELNLSEGQARQIVSEGGSAKICSDEQPLVARDQDTGQYTPLSSNELSGQARDQAAMSREDFLLSNGLLQIPNPIITRDALEPSDEFLNKFIINYYLQHSENVELALSWAYCKLLKTETNSDEDISIIKSYCKKYFTHCGITQ